MNRRAFLGSGLMSLTVGAFALLMGGGLPRPKQREGDGAAPSGKVVTLDNSPLSAKDEAWAESLDLTAAEAELGITPVPDHLRILNPWDGKTIQEADMQQFIAEYKEASNHFRHGYAVYPSALPPVLSTAESVSWDAPAKPTPLADMRRIHNAGRQYGLG